MHSVRRDLQCTAFCRYVEAKMCLVFMSFRAPSAALKQKNFHYSPNMQPIITLFQVLFKFMTFDYRFKIMKCVLFLLQACIIFRVFLFLINFQRHMHSICVWNMIKQSKPLQTRYDIYICDRYCIRTHVYVLLFSVKKRVFELSRV